MLGLVSWVCFGSILYEGRDERVTHNLIYAETHAIGHAAFDAFNAFEDICVREFAFAFVKK